MRTVTAVLFDKTGTLTKRQPAVTGVAAHTVSQKELLRVAGAVEADSEHPLARAIVKAAAAHGGVPRAEAFRAKTGRGVEARLTVPWPPSAARHCCANTAPRRPPPCAPRPRAGSTAARRCSTSCATSRSSAPSPWKTKSGPSRGKRSSSCTGVASALS